MVKNIEPLTLELDFALYLFFGVHAYKLEEETCSCSTSALIGEYPDHQSTDALFTHPETTKSGIFDGRKHGDLLLDKDFSGERASEPETRQQTMTPVGCGSINLDVNFRGPKNSGTFSKSMRRPLVACNGLTWTWLSPGEFIWERPWNNVVSVENYIELFWGVSLTKKPGLMHPGLTSIV